MDSWICRTACSDFASNALKKTVLVLFHVATPRQERSDKQTHKQAHQTTTRQAKASPRLTSNYACRVTFLITVIHLSREGRRLVPNRAACCHCVRFTQPPCLLPHFCDWISVGTRWRQQIPEQHHDAHLPVTKGSGFSF